MLSSLTIRGFKSLRDVGPIRLAPLTLFCGPNAVGKSNLLDAIVLLSRVATERTVADAVEGPIRGVPLELFTFPRGRGLPGLVEDEKASCRLEAEMQSGSDHLRYQIELAISSDTGRITVEDEYLAQINQKGTLRGKPRIERHDDVLRIRRRTKPAHPWEESLPLNHAVVSNTRYSGKEYAQIELARSLLASFRSYYLDPRTAMREGQAPREVDDIGPLGEHLAPFLYRLKGEKPKVFASIKRTLRTLIPSIAELDVELDRRKGIVSIELEQNGTPFSARVISEGTLRIIALLSVVTNPWGGSVVAFEEPENGVQPARIELIANILASLAIDPDSNRQVILTSHSPLFSSAIWKIARDHPERAQLYRVGQSAGDTVFEPIDTLPLFASEEIGDALKTDDETLFEHLAIRGLLGA